MSKDDYVIVRKLFQTYVLKCKNTVKPQLV